MPRAGASSRVQGGGAKASKLPLAGAAPGGQDQLTLSLSYLEEQTRRTQELSALERQMQRSGSSDQLEALKEAMDILEACAKIAASIMKGDQVPPKDLQYLMEHDIKGYQLAMAMRRPKEDPEKCKSAVPEEEQRAQGSAEAAPVEGVSGGESAAPPVESSASGGAAADGGPEA